MAFEILENTKTAKRTKVLSDEAPVGVSVHVPNKSGAHYNLVLTFKESFLRSLVDWHHLDRVTIAYDIGNYALLIQKRNTNHSRALVYAELGKIYTIRRPIIHGAHNEPYPERKMNIVAINKDDVTWSDEHDGLIIKLPKVEAE